MPQPHVAIGTSAVAVAANAVIGVVNHARAGTVKWRCAVAFAISGGIGALTGSALGKMVDGQRLIILFALLMLVIAALMLSRRHESGAQNVRLSAQNAPMLIGLGLASGDRVGLLWYRRRLPDRPGADIRHKDADPQRRRHVLVRDLRVRPGDRAELCPAAVSSTGVSRAY